MSSPPVPLGTPFEEEIGVGAHDMDYVEFQENYGIEEENEVDTVNVDEDDENIAETPAVGDTNVRSESVNLPSRPPSAPKPRKRTSIAWQFFERISDIEVQCNICQQIYKHRSGGKQGGTGTLMRHIAEDHKRELNIAKGGGDVGGSTQTRMDPTTGQVAKKYNKLRDREEIAKMLSSLISQSDEVKRAAKVTEWVSKGLISVLPEKVQPDPLKLAVSGHSRGGKIAFALALLHGNSTPTPLKFQALVGIDPVAGSSPSGRSAPKILKYIPQSFDQSIPVAVIGSGLGNQRAHCIFPPFGPNGVNHSEFFNESKPPCYYFLAKDYGHCDILDDEIAYIASLVSKSGKGSKELLRKAVGGIVVAFLEAKLGGQVDFLNDIVKTPSLAPITLDPVIALLNKLSEWKAVNQPESESSDRFDRIQNGTGTSLPFYSARTEVTGTGIPKNSPCSDRSASYRCGTGMDRSDTGTLPE
ncbi:hypothetical protein CQW23_15744 [Capsicum baccatum]|uniref:BED-type domain-containing protein n=1 Tax=Capsicum baccatum TaxID=33114 RepID=A0A2G2WMW7_CAPBA|nr:hypothetical protein CQW23_15744 [Capsicum baccatum]